MAKPKRIGEILVEQGLITPLQLEKALKEGGGRVGKTLIRLGFVADKDISKALANQYDLDYVDLGSVIIEPAIIATIPEATARKHSVIPFSISHDTLTVVMADPLNVLALDSVSRHTHLKVKLALSTHFEIVRAINRHYVAARSIEDLVNSEEMKSLDLVPGEQDAADTLERMADEVSIVRLVNKIMTQSIETRASDVHLEPDADTLRIRFRIDGILHDAANLPIKVHPAVASRIKILSGMDIAEKRLPQDGRFVTNVGGREIDMRTSTLPTIFGEKIVIRLLDKEALINLDSLSPSADSVEMLRKLVKRPYGMILITGPTGSGKSTTLYSLLDTLNSVTNNIVTVEDPVEYQIKRINQIQVNPRAGLTFPEVLRHVLRQDPDIIMIGEIRDRETAEIAIHAALTGHLVLSSLHTNDIAGTVGRLIDMGIEPFLVSSAIAGIANQRLVRKICLDCRETYEEESAVLTELGLPGGTPFYRGKGCEGCKGSGYKGRLAVIETVTMGSALRRLTLERADSNTINVKMKEMGFSSLRAEGIKAVLKGLTTFEEIVRATQNIDELE